jgi:hypothetical protein
MIFSNGARRFCCPDSRRTRVAGWARAPCSRTARRNTTRDSELFSDSLKNRPPPHLLQNRAQLLLRTRQSRAHHARSKAQLLRQFVHGQFVDEVPFEQLRRRGARGCEHIQSGTHEARALVARAGIARDLGAAQRCGRPVAPLQIDLAPLNDAHEVRAQPRFVVRHVIGWRRAQYGEPRFLNGVGAARFAARAQHTVQCAAVCAVPVREAFGNVRCNHARSPRAEPERTSIVTAGAHERKSESSTVRAARRAERSRARSGRFGR